MGATATVRGMCRGELRERPGQLRPGEYKSQSNPGTRARTDGADGGWRESLKRASLQRVRRKVAGARKGSWIRAKGVVCRSKGMHEFTE